ncbi:MAG: hypothetical protein TR69_WS6001000458 [candidate division WS6 bacterium OLB20]|uniref:Uncharacterized protein n=1 Tax=candidate division WS6 bacterium OLB20 TaxID=1617426 RepID=A0A136LXT3_9BACT|nr:MAG: hypothetical protein TR69_WS6001000458 [candidate division WS6 bacterium OLB20]
MTTPEQNQLPKSNRPRLSFELSTAEYAVFAAMKSYEPSEPRALSEEAALHALESSDGTSSEWNLSYNQMLQLVVNHLNWVIDQKNAGVEFPEKDPSLTTYVEKPEMAAYPGMNPEEILQLARRRLIASARYMVAKSYIGATANKVRIEAAVDHDREEDPFRRLELGAKGVRRDDLAQATLIMRNTQMMAEGLVDPADIEAAARNELRLEAPEEAALLGISEQMLHMYGFADFHDFMVFHHMADRMRDFWMRDISRATDIMLGMLDQQYQEDTIRAQKALQGRKNTSMEQVSDAVRLRRLLLRPTGGSDPAHDNVRLKVEMMRSDMGDELHKLQQYPESMQKSVFASRIRNLRTELDLLDRIDMDRDGNRDVIDVAGDLMLAIGVGLEARDAMESADNTERMRTYWTELRDRLHDNGIYNIMLLDRILRRTADEADEDNRDQAVLLLRRRLAIPDVIELPVDSQGLFTLEPVYDKIKAQSEQDWARKLLGNLIAIDNVFSALTLVPAEIK